MLAAVRQVLLANAEGETVYALESEQSNLGDEIWLEEGEQIIGVYGSHYNKGFINYLGLIVWKP